MNIIVLEHPRLVSGPHFNDIANTPLWSCVMAGYVHSALAGNGHDVIYLDANAEGVDFTATIKQILRHKPDLLTVNTVYFWEHTELLFEMLTELRAQGFTGHINLFGFFPTLHHERLIMEPAIDSIAVGECEQTIVELAENLEDPQIPGLVTRNHPLTPRQQIKDLDTIPFPHRNHKHPTASILASRGCYNHCSFCPIPSFYNDGPLWRGRSVANIIREIKELHQQGIKEFYFVDPNFIGPGKTGRNRAHDLLKQLKPLNIHFGMETRAGDLDDDLVQELVEAGLTSLLLGIESGSSQGLQQFGKNETVNEGELGIEICRRAGIEPEIGFLMFTPEATPETLMENMAFLERNSLLDRLDRTANLLCHKQILMAGTRGFDQYQEQGLLRASGPFGFIGEVEFQNPEVKAIARAVIALCHFILRQTGRQDSPLYFRRAGGYQQFGHLNQLLVQLITCQIKQPETTSLQDSLQDLQNNLAPNHPLASSFKG